MTRRLSDHDVEAVLSGDPGQGLPELGALTVFVAEMRASSPPAIAEDVAAAQVTAAAAAARSAATTPMPAAARPRRRLGVLAKGALSGITAKILLGTAVALAATGGAAAAGLLPAPIQDVLSRGAGAVGIEIPRAHHPDDQPTTTTSTVEVTTTASGSSTTTIPTATTTTAATTTSNGSAATPGALAGSYQWTGTFCGGSLASVSYSIDAGGALHLVSTNGQVTDQSADRLEIRFATKVRVRIQLEEHDHLWTIETSEQRDCGGDGGQGGQGGDDQGTGGGDDQGTGGDDEATDGGSGGDLGGSGGDQGDDESGPGTDHDSGGGSGSGQGSGGDQGSGDQDQ